MVKSPEPRAGNGAGVGHAMGVEASPEECARGAGGRASGEGTYGPRDKVEEADEVVEVVKGVVAAAAKVAAGDVVDDEGPAAEQAVAAAVEAAAAEREEAEVVAERVVVMGAVWEGQAGEGASEAEAKAGGVWAAAGEAAGGVGGEALSDEFK